MNRTIRRLLARRKQKILARLEPAIGGREPRVEGQPELTTRRIYYEMAERTQAVPCGGIGAIHQLARSVGLADRIDGELRVLKQPRPYQDDEGALFEAHRHWDIVLERAYTMHDEHPGGIRHEHPVNKIVARRRI